MILRERKDQKKPNSYEHSISVDGYYVDGRFLKSGFNPLIRSKTLRDNVQTKTFATRYGLSDAAGINRLGVLPPNDNGKSLRQREVCWNHWFVNRANNKQMPSNLLTDVCGAQSSFDSAMRVPSDDRRNTAENLN